MPSVVHCGNSVHEKFAESSTCAGVDGVNVSPATCAFQSAVSESIALAYVSFTPCPVTSAIERLNPHGCHARSAVRPTIESTADAPFATVSHDAIA